MEISTIIGFAAGMFFTFMSILMSAGWNIAKASGFIDGPSVMITIGGTVACMFISCPIPQLLSGLKAFAKTFKKPNDNPSDVIDKIVGLANLARKEGVLSLEDAAKNMNDEFLKKGIGLVVDATDPELVRNILETELSYIENRHSAARSVWETMASLAPSWGMIGTLIGLIVMLKDMSDPDKLGPSMAVALVTTFYGSLLANFIATPVVNKLKTYSGEEMLLKEVLIEGILSIQAGENPRIIAEKLKAFLSPAMRDSITDGSGNANKSMAGDD